MSGRGPALDRASGSFRHSERYAATAARYSKAIERERNAEEIARDGGGATSRSGGERESLLDAPEYLERQRARNESFKRGCGRMCALVFVLAAFAAVAAIGFQHFNGDDSPAKVTVDSDSASSSRNSDLGPSAAPRATTPDVSTTYPPPPMPQPTPQPEPSSQPAPQPEPAPQPQPEPAPQPQPEPAPQPQPEPAPQPQPEPAPQPQPEPAPQPVPTPTEPTTEPSDDPYDPYSADLALPMHAGAIEEEANELVENAIHHEIAGGLGRAFLRNSKERFKFEAAAEDEPAVPKDPMPAPVDDPKRIPEVRSKK